MSRENVDVVTRAWKAYAERGRSAVGEFYADDCLVEEFPEIADGAAYQGAKGWLERDRNFRENWGDFAIEPLEFIDLDDGDFVVSVFAMSVRGRGSGAPLDVEAAFLYKLRDGKIVRDSAFRSRAEALEAAGLRE